MSDLDEVEDVSLCPYCLKGRMAVQARCASRFPIWRYKCPACGKVDCYPRHVHDRIAEAEKAG